MNAPTPPNLLYRFRSIEYLLGDEYQELEKQTIYFASPEELNDPMEGLRDIVWCGDKIVWTNFLKHYIYSLVVCYFLYTITRESEDFDVDKIPIPARWDQPPNPTIERLFNDIWHQFLELPKIPEIIESLGNLDRKIGYGAIELLLFTIQSIFMVENKELYFQHANIPESEMQQLTEGLLPAQEWSNQILALLSDISESDPRQIDWVIANRMNTQRLNHLLDFSNSSVQPPKNVLLKNGLLMMLDFPKTYLNEIEKLLWPNWYAACFMKNHHNSSVWSHYGDRHRGACMIFEAAKTPESIFLKLSRVKDKSEKTMPFYEVSYADKPGEVDFFRSIGRLSVSELIKLWYTDSENNRSECASHIQPDGNKKEDWQEIYWQNFYRDITTKTKDWVHEQEWRLILGKEIRWRIVHRKKNRTLIYDFNSLKGIIFGVKTSDEHKLRIIDIIQKKCKEHNRNDFKFYQAYYSQETGDIRTDKLSLW